MKQYLSTPSNPNNNQNSFDFNIYQNSYSNLSINKNINNSFEINQKYILPKMTSKSFLINNFFIINNLIFSLFIL